MSANAERLFERYELTAGRRFRSCWQTGVDGSHSSIDDSIGRQLDVERL